MQGGGYPSSVKVHPSLPIPSIRRPLLSTQGANLAPCGLVWALLGQCREEQQVIGDGPAPTGRRTTGTTPFASVDLSSSVTCRHRGPRPAQKVSCTGMCSFKKSLFVNPSDRPQAAPQGVMTSHRQFRGSRLPHRWPALLSCPWFSMPLPLPTPHIPKPHASPDAASVGAARAPSAERLSANLCVGAAGTAWVPGAPDH